MITVPSVPFVKQKDIRGGVYVLKNNSPVQINCQLNMIAVQLHETKENEYCDIYSTFSDGAAAMIAKEFFRNDFPQLKKVDLFYFYFSEKKIASVYLYDLKKAFVGNDTIIHLIEQWTSSICNSAWYISQLEDSYCLYPANIHLGVITEDNDDERRRRELRQLQEDVAPSGELNSFTVHKRLAHKGQLLKKKKLLEDAIEGKVTINGNMYVFDIRTFEGKQHQMYFVDGALQSHSTKQNKTAT